MNGAGPENINLARPEDTTSYASGYVVGVHYYAADGFAFSENLDMVESTARVRIFIDGQVAYQGERRLSSTNDFWRVAEIKYNGSGGRAIELNSLTRVNP